MTFDNIANSRFLTRALVLLGLWPVITVHGSWLQRNYRFYQLFLQITFTFSFTFLMLLEVICSESLDHATEVLKFLLTEMALVFKILNTWYYARKAAAFLHEWETGEMFVLRSNAEKNMWAKKQSTFRKIMLGYIYWSISSAVCALLSCLFINDQALPFPYWTPNHWLEDYYWLMYFYELLTMPFTCLCNIEIDVFQCYLLLHLALCLRVVGMRLERLANAGDENAITREFLKTIKMHRRINDMARNCEQIISLPVTIQIMLSALIICFIIYRMQSVHFSDNPTEYLAMFQYVVAMSMQIFLPCYYANELTVQSQNLSKSLYNADWTGMSAYNRRLMLLYMQYLKLPLTMNNAYSLLALLLNVSDDKDKK
ncbi:unnamed protein product [Ceratitis capitata]|uniref:Odorant receptor n=1 Tax=Ceratitis capitata TaxID=7213 RepID=A0A811VLF0_CERCA|nr:unnamed protein product [Ceratitis capitata]